MNCTIYQWLEIYPAVFTVRDNKVYQGYGRNNCFPIYTLRDNKVYASREGIRPLYTIVGNKIFDGYKTSGIPVYIIKNNAIYPGVITNARPIYRIEKNY